MKNTFSEYADFQNLEDMYGRDHVFSSGDDRNPMIYTIDEGANAEQMGQPSAYSGNIGENNVDNIDPRNPSDAAEAKKLIDDNFDKTYATVLKGYVDLYTKNLQKLAKEENVPIEWVDGEHGDSTWYEFPLTDVKRKLFGN